MSLCTRTWVLRAGLAALIGLAQLIVGRAHAQYVQYIHTDALGSPVAITDQSRRVVERTEYEPYGKVLGAPVQDGPGYTGHVSDAATGLSYMQQRYYDPEIGRFLSVDPVATNANTGLMFNRFNYANNNPYIFTDPDGRCPDQNPCHEATPANFFRDNVVGRMISGLVGDTIAAFRSDKLNPLSNSVLSPGQIQDAKVSGLALLGGPIARVEGAIAGEAGLAVRVSEVHGVLDPIAGAMRTTAGLDTAQGIRVMGGGAVRDLTPAQRAILGPGEVAAKTPGAHAEVTVLNHAAQNGLTPRALEASRNICAECQGAIEAAGGKVVSPTRAEW